MLKQNLHKLFCVCGKIYWSCNGCTCLNTKRPTAAATNSSAREISMASRREYGAESTSALGPQHKRCCYRTRWHTSESMPRIVMMSSVGGTLRKDLAHTERAQQLPQARTVASIFPRNRCFQGEQRRLALHNVAWRKPLLQLYGRG